MGYLEKTYGYGGGLLVDDLLTTNVERIHELCAEIIERKLDIYWWCQYRADILVKHPDLVEHMAEAGCYLTFLCLESENEHVLAHWNKKMKLDTGGQAVELLRQNGIKALTAFIIGMEQETEEDIDNTIKYAKTLDAHQAQFSILTPYHGTADWDRNISRIFDNNWANFMGSKAVFHRDYVPGEVIEQKSKQAYRRFYNPLRRWDLVLKNVAGVNPRKLWRILTILQEAARLCHAGDGPSERLYPTDDGELDGLEGFLRPSGGASRCWLKTTPAFSVPAPARALTCGRSGG